MSDKPRTHGWDHRPGGFDPTPPGYWHYVHSSTVGVPSAWNASTNYVSGDTVSDSKYIYVCLLANKNVQPGVNAHWYNYWQIEVPIFQNGWDNFGSGYQDMRYRVVVGQPHILDKDSGSVATYSDHQLEIQGSATGGAIFTVVFYLPPAYAPQNHLKLAGTDDLNGFAAFIVNSDGSVTKT